MQRRMKVNVDQLIEFLNHRKEKKQRDSETPTDNWSDSVWGDFSFDPAHDESWSCSLSGIASYESLDRSGDDQ